MPRRKGSKNHGLSDTKLFFVWRGMRNRCLNKKNQCYKWYGARGITVCKEWNEDFLVFKVWAKLTGYKEGLTLDRKDNAKGYYPDNCRWTNRKDQIRNRRNTLYVKCQGKEVSLGELAERIGITHGCFRQRLLRGWSVEKIIEVGNGC